MHAERGVDIRCGVQVEGLHEDGVLLAGGELIESDLVVVGIGVVPATAWLDDSGLEIRDGIVCDATLNARSIDGGVRRGVYAAGDVLRWPNHLFDEEMRVEHWTNAAEQGAAAARNLLAVSCGNEPEPVMRPFRSSGVISLIFGCSSLGAPRRKTTCTLLPASVDDGKFLALYRTGDKLHGGARRQLPALGDEDAWARSPQAASWADAIAVAENFE